MKKKNTEKKLSIFQKKHTVLSCQAAAGIKGGTGAAVSPDGWTNNWNYFLTIKYFIMKKKNISKPKLLDFQKTLTILSSQAATGIKGGIRSEIVDIGGN